MKVRELIDHVAKDLLDDRKELISGESDVLFSDALIARYLAEAENLMARRAWVLEDIGSSRVTRIQLIENKIDYPVDKSILFVKSARLSDTDLDMYRVGYNDTRMGNWGWRDFWDVNFAYTENAGRPSRYSTDAGTKILRIRQKPNTAAATLKLHLNVVRLPLDPISELNAGASPEIPEEFHLALATYAAGKCLVRPTVEAELRTLGKSWLKDFDDQVDEAKRDRRRFTQSEPKHQFGGWASDTHA